MLTLNMELMLEVLVVMTDLDDLWRWWQVDPSEVSVLMTYKPTTSLADKEKIAMLLFEECFVSRWAHTHTRARATHTRARTQRATRQPAHTHTVHSSSHSSSRLPGTSNSLPLAVLALPRTTH